MRRLYRARQRGPSKVSMVGLGLGGVGGLGEDDNRPVYCEAASHSWLLSRCVKRPSLCQRECVCVCVCGETSDNQDEGNTGTHGYGCGRGACGPDVTPSGVVCDESGWFWFCSRRGCSQAGLGQPGPPQGAEIQRPCQEVGMSVPRWCVCGLPRSHLNNNFNSP